MAAYKPYILTVTILAVIGAIFFLNSSNAKRGGGGEIITVTPRASDELSSREEKSKKYELAKEITTPDGFINTDGNSVTIGEFVGKKVVLLDFWTYSCINCQRTTPYLNSWYEKYKDKGFVIIGVHTPEFEFEKNIENVKAAVESLRIKFPVVLDNDYSTWQAYRNQYWPRKYLIDIDGYIIYDHIGEGGYKETELKIQEALAEKMAVLGETGNINGGLVEVDHLEPSAQSPETYFGSSRNNNFGSGAPGKSGLQYFPEPLEISPNMLYLIGEWNIMSEYAETGATVGSGKPSLDHVDFLYRAKSVYFVAGSSSGREIEIEVLRDSKPLEPGYAGSDIYFHDGRSFVKIKENRLYKLTEDKSLADHLLELIISDPGLRAFTFTFG